ncbi:MAG: SMC family ATPase [Nanoarchaeota archaeon]
MILKYLKLENIRSYVNERIEFPTGSVLLSGDIGSGKSSVLLAIEFVLFGFKRKDLSGAALLRHGKKTGSVELKFDLDGREIVIKRVLKRGQEEVKQDAGFIIIDGIKTDGTHMELKSRMLELLGYPVDLLTKTKGLIYRYTVYTPQEAMKQVVLEDKDVRLNTLRKVFNIDKYKKIRENAQIYVRNLREDRKNYEGQIIDLEEKKKAKNEQQAQLDIIAQKLKEALPQLEKISDEKNQLKILIDQKEKQIDSYNKVNKEIELEELKLKNMVEKRTINSVELEKINKEIAYLRTELNKFEIINPDEFTKLVLSKEKQLQLLHKKLVETNKKLSEFETRIKYANETKEKISKIDNCPVCLQTVSDVHKKSINDREGTKVAELEKHIKVHKDEEVENVKNIRIIESELALLRQKEAEIKAVNVKKILLSEKENNIVKLEKEQTQNKQEIGNINVKKMQLQKLSLSQVNIGDEFRQLKQKYDSILNAEKNLEIEKRELEVRNDQINKMILILDEEIEKKQNIKTKLLKLISYQNWLTDHFVNLMNVIERHVMLQVRREFSDVFTSWFNLLMGDETLTVRLDDEFTPIIDQNGYETTIENLSGGEKTSVALAYRLALNKVINDIISGIKTKDIIILDEPTDGFSTEQLDRVRDVLEQLMIKQVIIVSHEGKVESFVDNVIRICKTDHVSQVLMGL